MAVSTCSERNAVCASLDLALREKGEPAFDLVDPGAVGWSEMNMIARSLGKPVADVFGDLCVL